MKIFDWLIRIQHLECYCQQIFQSTTSGFTIMNSNVKEQKETMANTTDAQHHHHVVPPNASHVADVAPSNAGHVVVKLL